MKKIRVLVADDHAIVREGLRTLIMSEPGIELVGEAPDGNKAVELAEQLNPDVILMDLVMPVMDGLDAIRKIKQKDPTARILVLTSFAEDDKVFPAIKAGALGYLLKDSLPQDLLQAIRDVNRGESSLHPSIALKLVREIHQPQILPATEHSLTDREIVVLKLVAQGLTNNEIAERLTISEWTVRTHVRNILGKLHLANRTQAALFALRKGYADLDHESNG
ncbi:MAG: response regulator transcription factor [Anaerolineales bacterium]|nr:response regulator transcription factor [Anaerolineales bacterium]